MGLAQPPSGKSHLTLCAPFGCEMLILRVGAGTDRRLAVSYFYYTHPAPAPISILADAGCWG
jgi:hypothetical protein